MTETAADPMAVLAPLTAPGGPFELVPHDVFGAVVPVFRNRDHALHEVLADSVQYGDREYIVTETSKLTFAEHARQVASLALHLQQDHGIRQGDRVLIAAANSPEWIVSFWAITSIGAIAVAGNAWWSAREAQHAVELTGPALVLTDAKRRGLFGDHDAVLDLEVDIANLAIRTPDAPLPSAPVDEFDPATVLFTSGTSGMPKGATHSHHSMLAVNEFHRFNDAMISAFGDPTDPRDRRYLLMMPLFHIGSLHNLAVPRLATGSTCVLYRGRFEPDRVLSLIQQERVTNWGAVPTMASRLLEFEGRGNYDVSSLRAFGFASAPSGPALQERFRREMPGLVASIADSYGLTETGTGVSVATPPDLAEAPGTLGRSIIGMQIQVRDALGEPVPAGVEGEVCVRGTFLMTGYWGNEEATAAAFWPDRWFRTGDIGVLDEAGRLRLSARRTDLINRGGENVYPAEIEAWLAEHPDVREAAVVGIPHPDLGQQVLAIISVRPGAEVTEQELTAYAASGLASYKVPAHWKISEEPLPRNATGKVIRTNLPTSAT